MFDELIRRWWIVAARGLVAMVFGLAAFLAPQTTLGVLVTLFGAFALADGVFTIGAGLSLNWMTLFLEGVVGGAVGLLTLFYPPAAQLWIVSLLIVAWAFLTGGLEVAGALRLRRIVKGPMVTGEWLLGASGVLSLMFGAVVAVRSDMQGVTLAWVLGGYAMVSGILLVALALNIRNWQPTQGLSASA